MEKKGRKAERSMEGCGKKGAKAKNAPVKAVGGMKKGEDQVNDNEKERSVQPGNDN